MSKSNLAVKEEMEEVVVEILIDQNEQEKNSSCERETVKANNNLAYLIIKKIVESRYFTNPSFFIIQKEVAEKYLYKKPYSILSLTTAMYADCKKVFDISPDSFRPKPHVTSSFISFSPTEREIDNKEDIANLIKLSFRQPRKNILNNLKGTKFEKGAQELKNLRPEQLSLDDYIKLYKYSY